MTDGEERAEEQAGPKDDAEAEAPKGARAKMGDGIKQGVGVLSAFKDALEETIQEARERGDLSTDRAREVMKEALDKAQAAGERARDRLDFVAQGEVDTLRGALDTLRDRVGKLEERVFGKSTPSDEETDPPTDSDSGPEK